MPERRAPGFSPDPDGSKHGAARQRGGAGRTFRSRRPPSPPMFTTLRPVFSLLLGIAFLLTGHGLQFTLLPLSGEAAGFDTLMLGLLGSSSYVGFVGGCLTGPYVILRARPIRPLAALSSPPAVLSLC